MVQPHPAGQVDAPAVEDAPAAEDAAAVEDAPAVQAAAFDPVYVRDFFHFLLVGLEGDEPESSIVTCFKETAALGLKYWAQSGMLVIVTAVWPILDSIPMPKFLQKKSVSAAEWEVLNLEHLVAVAGVTSTLLKLGGQLKKLRSLLKGFKSKGAHVEDDTELWLLSHNVTDAASAVEDKIPAGLDAATSVMLADLRRDALAVADQAQAAVKTVREAATSGAFLPSKPLHQVVKKVHRDLQVLLKATPLDLPYVNPFHV